MEYRKLISFGKSSFVISLPKVWINSNKLKKGDTIFLEERDNELSLSPKEINRPEEEKEIVIEIDGKDIRRIQRELISAYIQNYKTITLMGGEIKNHAQSLQQFIQELVALEIVEQDAKKIITRDFLNFEGISFEQIIRKMDVIIRSMLKDCKIMFKEDNYENIYLRDKDVNKFRFLIYRIVWFARENPAFVSKKFNMNQADAFNYWWMAYAFEAIADCIKRIARFMKENRLSTAEKEEFIRILDIAESMFVNAMKAYHTKNAEIAHAILGERWEILNRCDEFYTKNKNVPFIGFLIYNTKYLITMVSSTGRIPYQGLPG